MEDLEAQGISCIVILIISILYTLIVYNISLNEVIKQ